VAQFAERFGVEVVNYFGSNEGAALSSTPQDIPDRAQRAVLPRFGVPGFSWSARNASRVRTRLVDVDTEQDIRGPGQVGELRFQGPTIFSGYFNAPELTARAFDAQGYRTGDLFEIAGERQQFYRFVGRHKDIVIRGGMNISSEESRTCCWAMPRCVRWPSSATPTPRWASACAVVVPQAGANAHAGRAGGLPARRRAVAAFKLPEKLLLLPELPRNPLGKVLKRQLRDRLPAAAEGAPA
jgi:acyl-CoA synthetase (AMP-forming)/AMP-acid ligase II